MKRTTLLFVLLTYFITADGAARIYKTNWPDMGLNCIIVKNNKVSVDLILESTYENSSTFSNFKVVINNRSIPISFFKVSSTSVNGYYKYTYHYSERHIDGNDQFEYKISYVALPSNVFKEYGTQSVATEKKSICNPDNELADYLKISNVENSISANVYPNPFHNQLTIQYNAEVKEDMIIEIIDLNGKVLLSNTSKDDQVKNAEQQINTNELAPGIYYCRISNNYSSSFTKLVKAN